MFLLFLIFDVIAMCCLKFSLNMFLVDFCCNLSLESQNLLINKDLFKLKTDLYFH